MRGVWCFRAGVYPGLTGVGDYCTSLVVGSITTALVVGTGGSSVGTVTAGGGATPYAFSLSGVPVDGAGAAVFAIHATSGVITTTSAFANLSVGTYRATIMASDGAGLTGVGTLTIEVS